MPQPIMTVELFQELASGVDVTSLGEGFERVLRSIVNPLDCEDNDNGMR